MEVGLGILVLGILCWFVRLCLRIEEMTKRDREREKEKSREREPTPMVVRKSRPNRYEILD
jgi:hypothetical protein